MPQISPMYWLILMIFFFITLIFSWVKLYFFK